MNRGRVLNRPLEPAWLDAAFRLGREGVAADAARTQLTERLSETHLSASTAGRVVQVLLPVWVTPPAETKDMIGWALHNSSEVTDLRFVHLVALLATYPFFGDVCAIVGRMLKLQGTVATDDVRSRLRGQWGDRETTNTAQRNCIRTLRAFGALDAERGASTSTAGERFELPGSMKRWAAHGIILTRDAESVVEDDVTSAAELFFLNFSNGQPAGEYPFLETFNVGPRQRALVPAAR